MSIKTILVIDDEKEIADTICEIISTVEGRKIINAATPSEAYMRSIGHKFDLIITDFKMPKTDGVDLIKVLRSQKQNANTPVILISAYTEEALKKIGHMSDVFVINKPFMADELLTAVSNMMSIPSAASEDKKPHIDAQMLTEIISAASLVIQTLTGVEEIQVEKPFLYERDQTPLAVDISGLLEMRTPQFQGSIAISFPKSTYLNMVNGMTKESFKEMNDDNISHAGIIMGLIYEQAKTNLAAKGIDLSAATPQVITGTNHKFSSYVGQLTLAVPVKTLVGDFFLIVTAS